MVIPLPAGMIPMQVGPPTEYCMKMRPWFLFLLFVMGLILVGRLFLPPYEIVPGFFFALIIAMGAYAYHAVMDIQWLSYFGLTCFFCGVLDFVHLIDAYVKSPMPFFDQQYPAIINLKSSIRVMVPLVQLIGAWMVYNFYQDYHEAPASPFVVIRPQTGGSAQRYGAAGTAEGTPAWNTTSSRQSFQPFSGAGQTLGAGDP